MRNLWSADEFILVLNLYLKIPFGKLSAKNPNIIALAHLIGRTPNAVALRLVNFAACDPFHQARGISGMSGGRKQCQPYWDDYQQDKELFIFKSETLLAQYQSQSLEQKYEILYPETAGLIGETRIRAVKTRMNQHVFRQMIIANYEEKCAVTGLNLPELLVASHIVPWSENTELRLKADNGICLSALYDKAFDKGLITFNNYYEMVLSPIIKKYKNQSFYASMFQPFEGKSLLLPYRDAPNLLYLEYHRDTVFRSV